MSKILNLNPKLGEISKIPRQPHNLDYLYSIDIDNNLNKVFKTTMVICKTLVAISNNCNRTFCLATTSSSGWIFEDI